MARTYWGQGRDSSGKRGARGENGQESEQPEERKRSASGEVTEGISQGEGYVKSELNEPSVTKEFKIRLGSEAVRFCTFKDFEIKIGYFFSSFLRNVHTYRYTYAYL
jgi:hypothetical protein